MAASSLDMYPAPSRSLNPTITDAIVWPEISRTSAARRRIVPFDTRLWMAVAFLVEFLLAAGVVVMVGANERGIDDALLLTGRASFVLFWPAYAGGAAAALFGTPLRTLKQWGRNFGLAFASGHIVHLGLVAWLCAIGAAPPMISFVFFGIAVMWTYLLALVSVSRLQRAIGQRQWRLISFVGLNYIAFAFAFDFMRSTPEANFRYVVGYLPFTVLAIGGIALHIFAWAVRLARRD